MRFWIREIAGWLLIALSLFMFYMSYLMLIGFRDVVTGEARRMMIEAGQWSFVGIMVFRGGIHLLKVAVAARVCSQAINQISGDRPGVVAPRPARQRPQPRARLNGWS
jgi:hypothetical protein